MPEHLETTWNARSEFFQSLTLATHLQCCHAQSCVADAQISNNGSFCQSELKGPIELFTGHGNLVHHMIAMYVIKNHIFIICIIWESYPWLQFIHNSNWHMVRHVGDTAQRWTGACRSRVELRGSKRDHKLVVSTPCHLWHLFTCAANMPIPSIFFPWRRETSHCLHKHLRCTGTKWTCPLISQKKTQRSSHVDSCTRISSYLGSGNGNKIFDP